MIYLFLLLIFMISNAYGLYPTAGTISKESNIHRITQHIDPFNPYQHFNEAAQADSHNLKSNKRSSPYHIKPYTNKFCGHRDSRTLYSRYHSSPFSYMEERPYYYASYDDDGQYDEYH